MVKQMLERGQTLVCGLMQVAFSCSWVRWRAAGALACSPCAAGTYGGTSGDESRGEVGGRNPSCARARAGVSCKERREGMADSRLGTDWESERSRVMRGQPMRVLLGLYASQFCIACSVNAFDHARPLVT